MRELVLILPEAAIGGVLQKKVLLKIYKYSQENTLPEFLFKLQLY